MNKYEGLTVKELKCELENEQKAYLELQKKGVSVDMTRGRPAKEQLEIAMPMLAQAGNYDYFTGVSDARNYGELAGIQSARKLFGELLGMDENNVIVCDGSSLDIMYNTVQFAMQFGVLGEKPWNEQGKVKFVCPAPGYDRHFSICNTFGIEMIAVPMTSDGPDMDIVKELVEKDESVKGIWCVPKYSNPTGIIYSDEVVKRIASLKPAASDFRVFWDNAYVVHGLYGDDQLANVFEEAKKAGNEDMIYEFVSTSKITFAGSGVAAMAASEKNVKDILSKMFFKQINPNKVNQVMHANFLKDLAGVKAIMEKHADILRPKFELFEKGLSDSFANCDDVSWTSPRGGYFISVDVPGCAKRIVELALSAGVKFTPAGSTYPYKDDKLDGNIRVAPSVPSVDEIAFAVQVLVISIKLALLEKAIREREN